MATNHHTLTLPTRQSAILSVRRQYAHPDVPANARRSLFEPIVRRFQRQSSVKSSYLNEQF